MVAAKPQIALVDEVMEFLTSTPTPEQIIEFQPSEGLQQRASYLLEQNRQGEPTAEERRELKELSQLNHFMSMLKIRARKKRAQA